MLTRAPFLASAILSLSFLAGCTTPPKSIALSPEDAEFTTIASAKARNQRQAETPSVFFIDANEVATTELLAESAKPLPAAATVYLQSAAKLAKGSRLDALIEKNVRDRLTQLGYRVADVKDMPVSETPAKVAPAAAAAPKAADPQAAVIAMTAPPSIKDAPAPAAAPQDTAAVSNEVPASLPVVAKLSISHTVEENEAVVTLVLANAADGNVLSTHDHKLKLNKALLAFATH